MRVWVSGAGGKLGSEVCRQLADQGHEPVPADIAGTAQAAVDLLDRRAVARSLRGADAVIHCAGLPSPENVTAADLVHTNVMTTFNALEEAWLAGVPVAVLASSGSIYGTAWAPEPPPLPYVPVDEDSPLLYVDPYALTKDLLERTGLMYARRGMTVTALRLHWILTPQELLAHHDAIGDELGARNLWGYVELADAARACVAALAPRPVPERFQTLLVAAADTMMSRPTNELLDEHLPDIERRAALEGTAGLFDCSRAARVIGWTPRHTWRSPRP